MKKQYVPLMKKRVKSLYVYTRTISFSSSSSSVYWAVKLFTNSLLHTRLITLFLVDYYGLCKYFCNIMFSSLWCFMANWVIEQFSIQFEMFSSTPQTFPISKYGWLEKYCVFRTGKKYRLQRRHWCLWSLTSETLWEIVGVRFRVLNILRYLSPTPYVKHSNPTCTINNCHY